MISVDTQQTIAAVASPPGSAGRGIVRVSGSGALAAVAHVFEDELAPAGVSDSDDASSCAARAWRCDGIVSIGGFPNVAAAVWGWPTTRSYTGEPMVELHLPGCPPLLERVLETLYEHGVRPARAGEFTLRAFLAGRMDLTQAEAVLGVIDAEEHEELTSALNQLAGGLSGKLLSLREGLLELLADLEAGLDFVDEDIEFVSNAEVIRRLDETIRTVSVLESQAGSRMLTDGSLRVVLAGLPNAGKSTLFNTLAGSDQALVSDVTGTTRDYLATSVRCGSLTVQLIDTAGWEEARSGIEELSQQLRSDQVKEADLLLWCSALDADDRERNLDQAQFELASERIGRVVRVGTRWDLVDAGDIGVASGKGLELALDPYDGLPSPSDSSAKERVQNDFPISVNDGCVPSPLGGEGGRRPDEGDTQESPAPQIVQQPPHPLCGHPLPRRGEGTKSGSPFGFGTDTDGRAGKGRFDVVVSATTVAGLDRLCGLIEASLTEGARGERQFVGSTAARSLDSLRRSRESLDRAKAAAEAAAGDEFVALETRAAIECLGEIVGTVYTDDLLDRIFSRFCIGK